MLSRMGIQVGGKLHAIFEAQQITERFRKREFVVEMSDNPDYPQYVLFQLTGDRCDNLDGFAAGDDVSIEFNLRGREWTSPKGETKYFNSLEVWRLEKAGSGTGAFRGDDEPPAHDDAFFKDVPF
jgi:hypothetical protein